IAKCVCNLVVNLYVMVRSDYVYILLELDFVNWKCNWCIVNWLFTAQINYNVK
ncbi:hypothetical protein P3X46_010550, partial [Hevea brasiliensis]